MTASPDFSDYLRSIATQYAQWWELYTLMDAVGREQVKRQTEKSAFPFDFGLMVQTAKPVEEKIGELPESTLGEKPEEKLERLPVLAGMRKYAAEHVLLVGRPGSGKSTALIRLLLEEAGNQDGAAKIPVLVELRYWQTGVIDRILTVLQQGNYLALDTETLKTWLRQGRLLLLMDGLNELPSEEARRDVATFRRDYLQTPMIFTTRELSVGGDLGITKKLEMQPLTESQMQEFVRAYLPPNQAEQMLRQLKDRLRELGQTPLLLWMLCGLFQRLGVVPPNLGMVFRQFTQGYERSLKEDIPVTAESRRWWSLLLQRLAFVMMQGENPQEKPTVLQVAIAQQTAEDILTQYLTEEKFDKPRDFAKQWLEDLLKHHLIQINGDKIEFRHQLIQEYYAAEYLLRQLPKLSDVALQRQYLNYLKWTEAIALMLALVDDERLAVRVVELGLEFDRMLGARLAGEVKPEFHSKTISFITELNVPLRIKIEFLAKIHSESAIPTLIKALEDADFFVRWSAARALGKFSSEQAIPALSKVLKDIRRALEGPDSVVRRSAAGTLGELKSEQAIPALLRALEDADFFVRRSAAGALGELKSEQAIPALLRALEDPDSVVRWSAVGALGELKSEQTILGLLRALEDQDSYVRRSAAVALRKLNSGQPILSFLESLENQDSDVHRSAAETIIKPNSEGAISVLVRALEDQNLDVRRIVVRVLGELKSEQAIPGLLRALEDQDSDVRGSAAYALGELKSEQAISGLLRALEDQYLYDVLSLLLIFLKGGLCAFLMRINNKLEMRLSHYEAHSKAAEALGKLNSELAIPGLLKALKHQGPSVRSKAAEALGKLNSEQAIPGLLKALKDHDSSVHSSAAYALGNIGNPRLLEKLWEVGFSATSTETYFAIASIQTRYQYYNYEIFQAAQSSPPETTPQSSPSLIVQGDYIAGDKVEGDKAMGDKVTGDKNIHNVETVGNLNTGTVNVKGDQIGSQHNSGGKA